MRKSYIDNIRWMAVMLLFPYHTARVYDAAQNFYIKGDTSILATIFTQLCQPWFMPILFVVAGISTKYALDKRNSIQYTKERFNKLLVPLISGILILIPIQTYYAERFHNGYNGGYFQQYFLFFTKNTDLSGYTGGFTPGQLWFLLYLFVISLFALPIINLCKKYDVMYNLSMFSTLILPICILYLSSYVLDIGGKSLGEYFVLFLLGYYILTKENIQQKINNMRLPLLIIGIILTVTYVVLYDNVDIIHLNKLCKAAASWISILGIIGAGHHYLNFSNRFTDYFSKASFPLYIFHQSWIVMMAYYIQQSTFNSFIQYLLILVGSVLLSLMSYELFRRAKLTRFIFGIKK